MKKQLELLEQELIMLQENIVRIKKYQREQNKNKNICYQSRVVGEFKHRIFSLKQRLTIVSKITTRNLFDANIIF